MIMDQVYCKNDRVYDYSDSSKSEQKRKFEISVDWTSREFSSFFDQDALLVMFPEDGIHSDIVVYDPNVQTSISLKQQHPCTTANVIYPTCWHNGQLSVATKDEHKKKALALVDDIYFISTNGDEVELLRACFGAIEKAFAKTEIEVVNIMLEILDPSKIPSIASLGVARATARAKGNLPQWRTYVAKLESHLLAQGETVSHTMRGLISKDDQLAFSARRIVL